MKADRRIFGSLGWALAVAVVVGALPAPALGQVGETVGEAVGETVGVAVGVAAGVFISVWISAGLRAVRKIFTSSMRPSKTWPGWPGLAAIQSAMTGSVSTGPLLATLPTSMPSW